MAARRLIVVMVVLLLASSVAAALVPIPESDQDESSTDTTTSTEAPTARSLERTLRAGAGRPETIKLEVGDRLALQVVGQEYDLVEITGLGQLEDVDAASPARFDLVLEEPGSYSVRLTQAGALIGRIEVTQGKAAPDPGYEGVPGTPASVS